MVRRSCTIVLQLSVIGLLGACGAGTTTPDTDTNETAQAFSRPSVSAAELSNDGVNSISFAQAVAAGVVARPQPTDSGEPVTAAANPESTNPLASLPPTDTSDSAESSSNLPNGTAEKAPTTATSDSMPETGSAAPEQRNPDNTQPAGNSDNTEVTDNSESQTTDGVDNQSPATDNELSVSGENSGNTNPQSSAPTQFSSHTTQGFNGEVLANSIRVSWDADPDARGYNVYRQAEYVTTVFATEYIDEDVYDQDYYYEIQAFDYADKLYYIATGLTVSARTLGRTDPNAPKPNEDLLKDYELVFSDEFNGNSLDSSKWNTSYLWGTDLIINSEEQYYVDTLNDPDFGFNPFTFDGNNLTINSIKTPPALSSKALNQPYLSGVITSYDAFKFTYGYIETRAKVTYGRGYWPAFWLLNAYYVDDKPEIDIMEFIGDNQDVVYHTYHYYDSNGELRSTKSEPTPGIDYTSDFHTYAAEWRPGTIVFYVDGIEVHRVSDPKVSKQDMYVIANTALGGWWAGSPDENTPFPGKFTLDYIRVYQKTTPYDDFLLDDGASNLPLADDIPGQVSPNHRPTKEQWPEGYPDGL